MRIYHSNLQQCRITPFAFAQLQVERLISEHNHKSCALLKFRSSFSSFDRVDWGTAESHLMRSFPPSLRRTLFSVSCTSLAPATSTDWLQQLGERNRLDLVYEIFRNLPSCSRQPSVSVDLTCHKVRIGARCKRIIKCVTVHC